MSALSFWAEALAEWAIPEEIIAAAPESPWTYPVDLFRRRAERVRFSPRSPSAQRALEALPDSGSVIDVGSGAGAASLALVPEAGRIVAVDSSLEMLEAFRDLATEAGVAFETVEGSWPQVADDVEPADVVVCNHVLYNAADLAPFARALHAHARRRVVVEMTAEHPRAGENDLWKRFHDLDRPDRPGADDALAALREIGIDAHREDWTGPRTPEPTRERAIALVRMELALSAVRDGEIAEALGDRLAPVEGGWVAGGVERPLVTLWWEAD